MLHSQGEGENWGLAKRHPSPFLPIVVSIVAALVWLVFILFYALFWSGSYGLFQDFVVFFATLFVLVLAVGLMWLIWSRNQWHWWTRNW